MAILIDGYNLLYASDIFGQDPAEDAAGRSAFELTREALIAFVAESLGAKLAKRTTIVFDAADAPPGLPHTYRRQEILIRFARRYDSADQLIAELVAAHRRPKDLLVVSSDHAVQRSARQHGASYVDSEAWFSERRQELNERRRSQETEVDPVRSLRQGELNSEQVQQWLDEFGQL